MDKAVRIPAYSHSRGVHCATAALRNIVRHATGTVLSEAMIFGIASGLNFTYARFPGSRLLSVGGRGTDLDMCFADALGIELETSVVLDRTLAWDHLRAQIDAGVLVMLDTDSYSLPYLTSEGLLPDSEEIHFGGHRVLITGYDGSREKAILHDYAWIEEQHIALSTLAEARDPHDCVISPPMNRTFTFKFADHEPDWKTAMLAGLLRTVPLMSNSNAQSTGLPALDRFCRQVTRWPRLLGERDAYLNARVAGYMLEKGGTGGGAFRMFFARFLQECSHALDCTELASLSASYRALSGQWTDLAAMLTESSEDLARGLFNPANGGRQLVNEIWDQENKCVQELEQINARLLNRAHGIGGYTVV